MSGGFIWYELMTPDAEGAAAFYGKVVGWTIGANVMPPGSGDYRMIGRDDGGNAGGVLTLSSDMLSSGAKPGWLGYIHVEDVDAEAAAVVAEGGQTCMPPTTLDGVGRIAMLLDPFGAGYYIMAPQLPADAPDAVSDVFSVDRPQTVRWNELVAPDADAAIAFYCAHYGWTQDGAMPMGELGDYRFLQHEGVAIGAAMDKADFMERCGWTHYFGVEDIDRALAAVVDGGGQLLGGPTPIPGGEFSAQATDPHGAPFGLVGPRKEA